MKLLIFVATVSAVSANWNVGWNVGDKGKACKNNGNPNARPGTCGKPSKCKGSLEYNRCNGGNDNVCCVKGGGGNSGGSSGGGSQCGSMSSMEKHAKSNSQGRRPDGRCYFHVANFIDAVGYGGIPRNGFNSYVNSAYYAEARQFAEWMNRGSNASKAGLKNICSGRGCNPYDAPAGAIIVVRAGTPGTAHPTAGDIAIKAKGRDLFWNGGEMGYGGRGNFGSSNTYVLGTYVPNCY